MKFCRNFQGPINNLIIITFLRFLDFWDFFLHYPRLNPRITIAFLKKNHFWIQGVPKKRKLFCIFAFAFGYLWRHSPVARHNQSKLISNSCAYLLFVCHGDMAVCDGLFPHNERICGQIKILKTHYKANFFFARRPQHGCLKYAEK